MSLSLAWAWACELLAMRLNWCYFMMLTCSWCACPSHLIAFPSLAVSQTNSNHRSKHSFHNEFFCFDYKITYFHFHFKIELNSWEMRKQNNSEQKTINKRNNNFPCDKNEFPIIEISNCCLALKCIHKFPNQYETLCHEVMRS